MNKTITTINYTCELNAEQTKTAMDYAKEKCISFEKAVLEIFIRHKEGIEMYCTEKVKRIKNNTKGVIRHWEND